MSINASSPREIENLIKDMDESLSEQINNLPKLFDDIKISYLQTFSVNLFATLRLKIKADLFSFIEKMKFILLKLTSLNMNMMIEKGLERDEIIER